MAQLWIALNYFYLIMFSYVFTLYINFFLNLFILFIILIGRKFNLCSALQIKISSNVLKFQVSLNRVTKVSTN